MKKIAILALIVFILCGCSNSLNEIFVADETNTQVSSISTSEILQMNTDTNVVLYTDDIKVEPIIN